VLPWEAKAGHSQPVSAPLRDDDSAAAAAVAHVEAGVLASIISCNGRWCRISVDSFRGYIEQSKLWGAYQGEVIK
jgi:SH3-like domain-containing protein